MENVQDERVREAVAVEAETRAVVEVATIEVVTVEAAMVEEGNYTKEIEGGEVEVLKVESSPEIRGTII